MKSYTFKSLARTGDVIFGHNTIEDGNPAGGAVHLYDSKGSIKPAELSMRWQDGPVDREAGEATNGMFVEDLLEIVRIRLEFYQGSKFACQANASAIQHIKEAVKALCERRNDREARGVQGQHKT